ncbi:MAG: MarR family transcriptional regulator [Saprospiraceae bacterium]|nr:MarR family transcriptional regulator [Saprospiraceae bacterium]MCB9319049.1 MarR family transcriptional regulator [Lewinellaceae bacterium]
MKIEEAIKSSKFVSPQSKLIINLAFTASHFAHLHKHLLDPFDITIQQFNILRILRGRYPKTYSLKEITERMIDKMSNTSRLIDKLIQKGWVERIICPKDRRQVDIGITPAGLNLIAEASDAMDKATVEHLYKMSEKEMEQLNALLDKMRD